MHLSIKSLDVSLALKAAFPWPLFWPLLIWNSDISAAKRTNSLTWRVEVDNVFHCEVSGLSSFQTISQQTQEQEPGQSRARFHGRPRVTHTEGPWVGTPDDGRELAPEIWRQTHLSVQLENATGALAGLPPGGDRLGRDWEPSAQESEEPWGETL